LRISSYVLKGFKQAKKFSWDKAAGELKNYLEGK